MARQSSTNRRRTGSGPVRIAVVGVRGSGKTTLAAGLYASTTESLTVGPADNTTRRYLDGVKSGLDAGCWPSPTPQGERPYVNLLVNMGEARTVPISFVDYMGDMLGADENFVADYMGSPDGAMLLFNPGMDALSDVQARNAMVAQYRKAIDHLKKRGCRHVAFVVTASDRLDGDLADRREALEGYEKEITNYLRTVGGGKWWTRIPVTVTGRLESQDRPRLAAGAENTASRPFTCLLDKIREDRSRRGRRRVFMRVCLAALGAALAAGGLRVCSGFMEKRAAEHMLREDAETPRRLREELDGAGRLSGCVEVLRKARAWTPMPGNEQMKPPLLELVDMKCMRLAESEWNAFETSAPKAAVDKAVGEFSSSLKEWEPASAAAKAARTGLLERLPDASMTWITECRVREMAEACGRSAISADEGLSLVKGSMGVAKVEGASEGAYGENSRKLSAARARLLDAIIRSYADAEWNWKSDFASPEEWREASLDCWGKSRFGRLGGYLSEEELRHVEASLAPARKSAVDSWRRRQEKVAADFVDRIAALSAVDACVEYGAFCSEHPANPGLGRDKKGVVRSAFIEKVAKAFSDYMAHYDAEFRGQNRIYETSGDAAARVEGAEGRFSDFRTLCQLLQANAAATLGDTKYFRFAVAAAPELKKGQKAAFMQQLVVTNVSVSFGPTTINTGGYWTGFGVAVNIVGRRGTEDAPGLSIPEANYDGKTVCGGEWIRHWSGRHGIGFNAWTELRMLVDIRDFCGGRNGKTSVDISLMEFHESPSVFERPLAFEFRNWFGGTTVDSSVLRVRVDGEVSGRGFLDLWRELIDESEERL